MATITVQSPSGKKSSAKVELADELFGIEPNVPVMHQVVTAQLAARRAGTQSTKTRAEVRGGGAKPWRQKGTGRARQGSIRSPQWRGGGIALGPKPRSYAQRTPKKMIRLALRSALSDRAAENKVIVVDEWGFDAPSAKAAIAALGAIGLADAKARKPITERILVVVDRDDEVAAKSFRNLEGVQLITSNELNAYDVLVNDWIVFSTATLPTPGEAKAEGKAEAKATKAPAKAAVVEDEAEAADDTTAEADDTTVEAEADTENEDEQ